jgi:hypothetical protein
MISKRLLVGLSCIGGAAWVGASAAGGTAAAACKPGVISYGGAKAIVYCGAAKATVKTTSATGPLTLNFANGGRCEVRQRYVRIDVGTRMLSAPNKPKPDYFQLVIGATPGANEVPVTKDGTYGRALITVIQGGTEYLPDGTRGTVTLKGNRTKGTFKAKSGSGQVVTGAFTC